MKTELKAQSTPNDDSTSSSASQSAEDSSASSSSSSASFEGVSADQFDAYQKELNEHLDFITASSIVLIFALMFCSGIVAVQTLIRSFEVK